MWVGSLGLLCVTPIELRSPIGLFLQSGQLLLRCVLGVPRPPRQHRRKRSVILVTSVMEAPSWPHGYTFQNFNVILYGVAHNYSIEQLTEPRYRMRESHIDFPYCHPLTPKFHSLGLSPAWGYIAYSQITVAID